MKSVSIHISGKVQGVFYRKWAKGKADQLGLTGWIRNEDNGSVYAEVTGETETLDQFVEYCRKGPDRAVVTSVIVEEISPKSFERFRIEH